MAGNEGNLAKTILIWVFQIAVVLACAVVVAIFFFQSVTMQEGSMEPTLATGDRFFINRMAYKLGSPKRGDIIVFKTSTKAEASLHIKRVIGLPGETIQIKNGSIYIDGEEHTEGIYVSDLSSAGLAAEPVELGSNEYFVIGDNHEGSDDSRTADVGNVKRGDIFGKVWFVISPGDNFGRIRD